MTKSLNLDLSRKQTLKKPILKVVLFALGILVLNGLIWFVYIKSIENDHVLTTSIPNLSKDEENKIIIQKFSKIYSIDIQESPSVIRLTDVSKLKEKDANFYKNSINGDYVIILDKSKFLFIYRESENRIISAGLLLGD